MISDDPPPSDHPGSSLDPDRSTDSNLDPIPESGLDPASPDQPLPDRTRAGYVAVVGRPNAGKSTLMNAMVGEKLSIVTPKAQTTWQRVTGILTDQDFQMVFLDTPGLLEVRDRFQASMLDAAHEALAEADVILLVLDAKRFKVERDGPVLQEAVGLSRAPRVAVVNKIDLVGRERVEELVHWASDSLTAETIPVSALTGEGVGDLLAALRERLPVSPFFYPPDEIASEPVRFFVAEMIRETVFEQFREEIPYSVACEVGEFRESQDPVYIQATLFADRQPQKRILVGDKGSAIRKLGKAAREKIERFLDRPVYLDLWVKVLPGWRRQPRHLRRLGFRVPDEHPGGGGKG